MATKVQYPQQITPEERKLLDAKVAALQSESAGRAEENATKRDALRQNALIEQAKLGLGEKELGQKDKQAKLAAAMDALGLTQKSDIAGLTTREGMMEQLTHRPDINAPVLAETLARAGYPELYNSLATAQAQEREKAIQTFIPAIQGAKSDEVRNKSIRPALEARFPGAYDEALARAFPKAGQAPTAAGPKLWEGTPPAAVAGGAGTSPLAETLLEAAGVSRPKPTPAQVAAAAPPIDAGPVEGLAGSTVREEGGNRYGINTPTGGYIGGEGDVNRIVSHIAERNRSFGIEKPVAISPIGDALGGMIAGPGQPQDWPAAKSPAEVAGVVHPVDQLLAAAGATPPTGLPAPTPTPPPMVAEAAPVPGATPPASPIPVEVLLELARRKALEEQQQNLVQTQ